LPFNEHVIPWLIDAWQFAQDYAERIFVAAAVICVAEYLVPRSRNTLVSRARGALFLLVYIVITAAGLTLFSRLWTQVGVTPPFHIDLRSWSSSTDRLLAAAGGVAASLIVIQISEFFYYWFHRLQHRSNLLWRFHAVHHSVRELSAFNSNHHPSEELLRIPFVAVPFSLLFSFEQGYVPWAWAFFFGWQGAYEHSSTRLTFGPLRVIAPDNRFHRIHHSIDERHQNRNFGSASLLWDAVFGTLRWPRKGEWPDTGLATAPEPRNVADFLWRPFRR